MISAGEVQQSAFLKVLQGILFSKFPQPPYSRENDSNNCKEWWPQSVGGQRFLQNPLWVSLAPKRGVHDPTQPAPQWRPTLDLVCATSTNLARNEGQARHNPLTQTQLLPTKGPSIPPPHPAL